MRMVSERLGVGKLMVFKTDIQDVEYESTSKSSWGKNRIKRFIWVQEKNLEIPIQPFQIRVFATHVFPVPLETLPKLVLELVRVGGVTVTMMHGDILLQKLSSRSR